MITKEFRKACVEILEILKYVPEEEYNKIPKDLISFFEEEKLEEYRFEVNISKALIDQNMLEKTRDILTILCRDYWSTKEQKEELEEIDRKIIESTEDAETLRGATENIVQQEKSECVLEKKEPEIEINYIEKEKITKDLENDEPKIERRRKRASEVSKKDLKQRRGALAKVKKRKTFLLKLFNGVKALFFRAKGKH